MSVTDCIFCKIVEGEVPSSKIFENEKVLVFKDISPKAPVHYLVIPKKHFKSITDMSVEDKELVGELAWTAKIIAEREGFSDSGYRFIANSGPDSGQLVDHLHFHIMAGRPLGDMG